MARLAIWHICAHLLRWYMIVYSTLRPLPHVHKETVPRRVDDQL